MNEGRGPGGSVAVDTGRNAGWMDWPSFTLLASAVLVWAGYTSSLWYQSQQPTVPMPLLVIVLAMLSAVMAGAVWLSLPSRAFPRLTMPLPGIGIALAVGLLLRLALALWISPMPLSDGASYLQLAQRIADGESYRTAQTKAYWPPGEPLALAPFLSLVGDARWAVLVLNLLAFTVACTGVWRLGLAVGMSHRASLAAWLLALWPTSVLIAGLPEKEQLVIALMPWLLLSIWRVRAAETRPVLPISTAGVLVGVMALIQPALLLLPVAVALWWWLYGLPLRSVVLRTLLMVTVLLLTVSPWTLRNWRVLGSPVLISTNGGSNLYRANNELATGGYVSKGRVDVEKFEEREASRQGTRLALEWITSHPGDFLILSAGKLMLFGGDDSYGAYASLRRGRPATPPWLYAGAKLLASLPWLVMWALIARSVWRRRLTAGIEQRAIALLLALPYFYLLSLHAIFESGGRYHLPALPGLLVLACWLAARPAPRDCG